MRDRFLFARSRRITQLIIFIAPTALTILCARSALAAPADAAPQTAASPSLAEPAPAGVSPVPSFETVVPAPVVPAPMPTSSSQPNPVVPMAAVPTAEGAPARRATCPEPGPMREGFYLRILRGSGYARFHGTGPHGSVSASGVGADSSFAIGGSVARGLVIAGTAQSTALDSNLEGGPFASATVTSDGLTTTASAKAQLTLGQLGILVDWYPSQQSGFHGGLSAGLGAMTLTNDADGGQLVGTATSGSLFAGYDFAISRSWALGLMLIASGATSASMKNRSGEESGYKLNGYSIELSGSILYF